MQSIFIFATIMISLFFTACSPKQNMIHADSLVGQGNYLQAAKITESYFDTKNLYAKNNLLWSLESGAAYFYAQDTNKSNKMFDKSEDIIKYFNEQLLLQDISQTVLSTLLNDTTRPYIGTQYDGIMANTYKAINYMALGDRDSARVEFNRAIDRQRRAKIFFHDLIEKEKKSIEKKESESLKDGKNLKVSDTTIDSILHQNYPSLYAFKPYPDFINPTTTYIAGLFARADGNSNKADSLLKEAYGMMQENSDVKADLQNREHKPTVWVIFENGQAPTLQEWRIDFPIWIFSGRLSYISVALPKLRERHNAYPYLTLETNDKKRFKTHFLSSMDRVIKTEFKKNYKSVVKRAILSTATKAAINYTIQESANNNGSGVAALVSIASSIYQISSTHADTRSWTTLPKEFQLARFNREKNSIVNIYTPNNELIQSVKIPNTQYVLIYVKIATPNALASVRVIPF